MIKKEDKFNIIIDNHNSNITTGNCVNNIVNFLLENKAINQEELIKKEIPIIVKKEKNINLNEVYDFPEDYPIDTDNIIETISEIENKEPNQLSKTFYGQILKTTNNDINIKSYENAVKYISLNIF